MTDVDTDAIRARLEAATPGPWAVGRHAETLAGRGCPSYCHNIHTEEGEDVTRPCAWIGGADATLIAHAPADIAALLDEVERLQAHVAFRHRMDAATGAGEGARTDGEPVTANPYSDDDVCWACWDAGWHAQDAVERLCDVAAALEQERLDGDS